jgi:Ca2+/Na+ antiporter
MSGKAVARAPRDIAHEGFLSHGRMRWAKISAALSALSVLAYALIDQNPRPNGGTALGYLLGTIGLLLIIWLSTIGLRKRIITTKPFSLKAWTSAHVYLGLSLIVIGTLHSGFQLGWNVHTLAWVLMMIVIVSGIYGVVVYARLPKQLSANRNEATQPQMLEAIRTLDRQLDTSAQPLARAEADFVRLSLEECEVSGGLWQRLTASHPKCGNARARDAIQGLVNEQMRRGRPDPALTQILFLLERKDAALAQVRRHIRMKTQLEIWLYLHVPMTFALMVALTAHMLSVFIYW